MIRFGLTRAGVFSTLALLSLALGGCGGASNDDNAPSNLSRTAVIELLRTGVKQSANLSAGTTRGKKNGRGSIASRVTRDHESEEGGFYQDESLGLWVETVTGSVDDPTGASGERFWIDHDKTQPGGHSLRWVSESGVYPIQLKSETTFLAGSLKGLYELREDTINEDESGSSEGSGVVPNEVEYTFTGSWQSNGERSFSERAEFADGSWQTYALVAGADLETDLTIVSSQGVTYKLHTNEDLSGTGTIEGAHDGLPATMAWDESGVGTIIWSDGTTSPFNLYDEA